ncbi:uncharacterized protein LOC143428069 [Xylocopa sonorina]|uniref:uncharacterized protein LOC143428069 n=1 Tax=Xylocopa sonorina TaxID=1818115 RepID=UPI00403A95A8
MNSFDSTIESVQNISKIHNEDCNCTAIDKATEQLYGEAETLKIIDEFQKLYETRIENVDREVENEYDQICMKLEISKEWIRNLREQNVMLVQVVEDLEQAACNRVKLLEQKLNHSSLLVSGNVTKSIHTEKTIHALSNRVNNLEKDEECMQQKIEYLQSDIRGLLELIRRASQENHWNLDDIKFFEIQPSDIPMPNNCTCDQVNINVDADEKFKFRIQEDINHENVQSLKLQIKHLQENEKRMIIYQKDLEDKLSDLNIKLQTKEDIIKKYVSHFQNFSDNLRKHAKLTDQIACSSFVTDNQNTFDETCATQNACVDVKPFQEDIGQLSNPTCQQNQIISYLNKVKSLMEQEKSDLCKLKRELEKTVEKLCCKKREDDNTIKDEYNVDNVKHKLTKNIKYINNIYSKKEESIEMINSLLQMDNSTFTHTEILNLFPCTDINQQFKLMDIFRMCAIEAQVTMDDIKDEMNLIISSFKCRHQKYIDVNKEVMNAHNQLVKSREKIAEAINRLQLQEEERIRHTNRISSGKNKLKDLKNEINLAQSRLSENISGYTEICICNDILYSIIEEVEQISPSLEIVQIQGSCITKDLENLKNEFYEVDLLLKKVQEKINEALSEHNTLEATFSQKEHKLQKLETEVDMIHSKVQKILESFLSREQIPIDCHMTDSELYMQIISELLQAKQDVYRLRKEHEELVHRLSQKSVYPECDKKTCLCNCRVNDLQDQVKILKHEAKYNEETNNFLRNSIQSIEEELHVAQLKADNYRRSHSIDNLELKKKIIELESTLKLQKEIEYTLRRQLNDSEMELKKSKELLNPSHSEHSVEETLLHCGRNQLRHDSMMTAPQLFKMLQNTINSTKNGLQELKVELKQLICEDSSNHCSSAKSIMNLLDNLQRYESELDNSFQQIEELKNALYSKDKLIEDRDEIIKIQKHSIVMTQAELKELHQKFQEKIDNQDQIITEYEKEKKELLRQNKLQNQTIGHLQNAVVEAKKCIDQMACRTLEENSEAIHLLKQYAEETESQYNECFAEAAKQDRLLELQQDSICELQQRISCMTYNNCLTIIFVHITYYSILKRIQEQLETCRNDIQILKNKMNTQQRNKECQCKIEVIDKSCTTQDILTYDDKEHDLESEMEILIRENEDMKRQLQKYKLDFDIIDKELKIEKVNDTYAQQISFELQKLRDTECCLQYENEQLKSDLKKQVKETKDLLEKLQLSQENGAKLEKLLKKLEDKQIQINGLCNQVANNETVIKKQREVIDELEKKLNIKNQQIKAYLSELNEAEEEMSTLHNRIQSLKMMLKEKSDDMAKLQADYEVIKNDNSILKMETNSFEDKTKEDICQLQIMIKDLQMQLCFTENNYHRVTEDFNKAQERLIEMTKREADLQKCLTNMEKDYCSKLLIIEKEKAKLSDCLDKLKDELQEIKKNYSLKTGEYCKLQNICKSYAEQLDILQQQIKVEREKIKEIEESKRCLVQQLQNYVEQNCVLVKEKAIVEQTNCEIISELQETHKSLLELKRECQLKNKSLACISAELTETAMSRSELCNQSQYVVSCIRVWMEEQQEYVNKLNTKFKSQQQQLIQCEFEKKALLDEIKKLRRINHALMQRLKRMHRHGCKSVKNICMGCQILPQNIDVGLPINSKYPPLQKKLNIMKAARRISLSGNWWLPRMKYLVNEWRKDNVQCTENCINRINADLGLEENHDCGYQSSTSK